MKKLFKNTRKTSLVLAGLLLSFSAFSAGPIAVVSKVTGKAFVTNNGMTRVLKAGDHISDFAEVMTETGSQLTLSDYHDHQYHLSGSGQMKFLNRVIELKSGYLWFQSFSNTKKFQIQTANSQLEYGSGEGIFSFDPFSGKSQILVIKGDYVFSNILENMYSTDIREGQFSFIQNDFENGSPRTPTPIGFSSYKKVTSLFSGVSPMDKHSGKRMRARPTVPAQNTPNFKRASRGLASKSVEIEVPQYVEPSSDAKMPGGQINPFERALESKRSAVVQQQPVSAHSGGVTTIIKNDSPELKKLREDKLLDYQANILATKLAVMNKKKVWKPSYSKKSGVEVHIFGAGHPSAKKAKVRFPSSTKKPAIKGSRRGPASVGTKSFDIVPKPAIQKSAFESALVNEYKKQMRHSEEQNSLIDDLNSVDMDYKKSW